VKSLPGQRMKHRIIEQVAPPTEDLARPREARAAAVEAGDEIFGAAVERDPRRDDV
jgi:hypothetical protein